MMPCYHSGSPPLAGKASAGTPLARDTLAGYRPPMPSGAQKHKAVHSRKAPGPYSARLSRSLSAALAGQELSKGERRRLTLPVIAIVMVCHSICHGMKPVNIDFAPFVAPCATIGLLSYRLKPTLSQAGAMPAGATKGLSDRPLETFGTN